MTRAATRRAISAGGRSAGIALVASLGGCLMVPSSPEPNTDIEHNATFEPGFGTNEHQLARWSCSLSFGTPDAPAVAPGVTLVLVKHPTRGLLLHNVTDDLVMEPAETIPGGGLRFISSLRFGESNTFIVPPEYSEVVEREWSQSFTSVSTIETNRVKQRCAPGPRVRFL